jgi:hypothetical protein
MGSIITLPIILNFGTISRSSQLHTQGKSQWYTMNVSLGQPQCQSGCCCFRSRERNVSPANNWTTKPQSSILQPSHYHDYVIASQVHKSTVWHKICSPHAWAHTIIKSFLVSISLARILDLRIKWMPNHFSVGTHTKTVSM